MNHIKKSFKILGPIISISIFTVFMLGSELSKLIMFDLFDIQEGLVCTWPVDV